MQNVKGLAADDKTDQQIAPTSGKESQIMTFTWRPRWQRVGRQVGLSVGAVAMSVSLMGVDSCGTSGEYAVMRDGVQLPVAVSVTNHKTAPTVVDRTPFGSQDAMLSAKGYTDQGYNYVSAELRGTGGADGNFNFFSSDGWADLQDGYDTVQWAAEQEWSDGDVCVFGGNVMGFPTLLAAGAAPPNLRCTFSSFGSVDFNKYTVNQGGAFRQEVLEGLEMYLGMPGLEEDVKALSKEPSAWEFSNTAGRIGNVRSANYLVTGWFDISSQSSLDFFSNVQIGGSSSDVRNAQKLLIGPWGFLYPGSTIGELIFPDDAAMTGGEDLRWFERWLKGMRNGVDTEPAVKYFRMGDTSDTSPYWNVWVTTESWPVESVATRLFFHKEGELSFDPAKGQGAEVHFDYDPANPCPTVGGANVFESVGPRDQRAIEARSDVISFTSESLAEPLAITGRISAELFVQTSAKDTDFVVKLTDVYPDGTSMLIQDGIVRMSRRAGAEQEVSLNPDEIYNITVDLWSSSYVFNRGHKVRVLVTSSNYPRFDLNNNLGKEHSGDEPQAGEASSVIASQKVWFSSDYPSALVLPVVPLVLPQATSGR